MIILVSFLVVIPAMSSSAVSEEKNALEAAPRSLMTLTPEQVFELKPQDQEIRNLLIREQEEVARLTSRLEATKDQMEALEIQREIGARKQLTEIAIMEVQANYAVAAGHLEKAEALRKAVQGMKDRLPTAQLDKDGGP